MSGLTSESTVVVTGAAGPAGLAVVTRLVAAGAFVVGVDTAADRLEAVSRTLGPNASQFSGAVLDLLDEDATRKFAASLAGSGAAAAGKVDGVVHLVGGWRGGAAFSDNTVADWLFLHALLVRTVQNVSLAFHDALVAAEQGRFVLVSATAASRPTAGSAGYAAAKAAAEAWTMAMADSFRRLQSARQPEALPQTAAATVLVVKALVHDGLRAANPGSTFDGYTDVADLAEAVAGLWESAAATVNGRRTVLAP